MALTLLRITQEATINALKYAQASEVWVRLAVQGPHLALTVRDNGRGFDPAAASGGHGLCNMQKRAEELGGTFCLQSGPGSSRVKVMVPLREA